MDYNSDYYFIDTTSVMLIINKLELYIENMTEIVNLINISLEELNNAYLIENQKVLIDKRNMLIESLSRTLENKKSIVEYLKYTVEKYINIDENIYMNYSNIN